MGRLKYFVIASLVLIGVSCEPIGLLLSIMETTDPPGWELVQTLTAGATGSAGDEYGISVDLYGDYAIVGAYNSPGLGTDRGAAYIYHLDPDDLEEPWKLQKVLTSNTPADSARFGGVVTITDNVAVVTSNVTDEVEMFMRSGSDWTYNSIFTEAGDFGYSTDAYGDHIVVGDFNNNAFFYRWNGATWVESIQANLPGTTLFGSSVAIYEGYAVVGDLAVDGDTETSVGAAHVYQWNGSNWTWARQIDPFSETSGAIFGTDVAIFDGKIVVGAPGEGAAYIFSLDGAEWKSDGKISVPGVLVSDNFGSSVSVTDRMVAIGAYSTDASAGKAFIVERYGDAWQDVDPFSDSGSAPGDEHGFSVAMYDDFLFVGASKDDNTIGVDAGSVYVYRRSSVTGIKGDR